MLEEKGNEVGGGSSPPATKSLADVLLVVLDDYQKKFWKLLLMIASVTVCLGLIIFAFVWLGIRSLPSRASQIQLGPASILFSQSEIGMDKYVLVVPPQGWTRTGIFVPEGATLEIEAGGKVQIDLTGLNRTFEVRRNAEDKIQQYKNEGKLGNVSDKDFAPDDYFTKDYFTEDELKAMKPTWKWIGPDGTSDEEMKVARPARRRRSILPNNSYGVLLAAFDTTDVDPSTDSTVTSHLVSGAFKVGSKQKMTANHSGYLYFAINDVQGGNQFPDMFQIDNVGAFFAKVSVATK